MFMQQQVGTVVQAITLRSGDGHFTEALTDNYLKMKIPGGWESNRWMEVNVARCDGEVLVGRPRRSGTDQPSPQTDVTSKNTQKSNKIIDLQPFAG
jgi:hypothetical protein